MKRNEMVTTAGVVVRRTATVWLAMPATSGLVDGFFPSKVNDLGGTFYAPLVFSIELLQAAVLLLCGMAVALIGGKDRWQKVCVAMATLDMLAIGVMVQWQFWEALPVWHHWIFFLLILVMMPLGGSITRRLRETLVSDDAAVRLS